MSAQEYIDTLDAKGNPTGEKKTKFEVIRDGDWHRSVHMWIVNNEQKLLIQKRSATKRLYPNTWDISVAGHISAGEDPITGALREAEEELSLRLEPQELEHLFTIRDEGFLDDGVSVDREFVEVYLIEKEIVLSTLTIQQEELVDVRWMEFRELEKMIVEKNPEFCPHAEYEELFKELHRRYG